jgi:type III restriction enzyme
MARRKHVAQVTGLPLPASIAGEVEGWRNQGYSPFPSETTRQLLAYWFEREHDEADRFYDCQRKAIETVIYLHEVRGIRTLRQLYEQFAPERLTPVFNIAKEIDGIPFMKYCVKMATGSGKTWVLAALLVWQYFNAVNGETNAPFSSRFLIATPGLEVLNRLLDSFNGKRDPKTGNRDPATSDYKRQLFMPQDPRWKDQFHLEILEPDDIRNNTSPPDGPFVALTNWQQFVMAKDKESLAEQIGLSIPEEPRGEVIADFMTAYPDLVVMNDEAHHVHGKKTARADELVWRKFMGVLHDRMIERHGRNRGLFMQVDFSATPFYGSGRTREYFPHIVYDYDLRDALNEMLVKQLFLEERQAPEGKPPPEDLDFRAERETADKGKRGHVLKLSDGQKQILGIGAAKLNQLTNDFLNKGLDRKPVLMVLCEDTTVADLVYWHLLTCEDHKGDLFQRQNILLFHSELKKDKHGYTMEEARGSGGGRNAIPTLDKIDLDDDPLRIVVSVLALREGFDKTNICVTAVLRATDADLLLEQIVGRGLRLMFPAYKYPELQEAKGQAFEDLRNGDKPHNSLDFLYIVEHPRFRTFYDGLRKQGYLIAGGDSREITATGDIIPIEAAPDRIPARDIAWPVAMQEEAKLPDLSEIQVKTLPSGTWNLDQLRQALATIAITDRHLPTDTRADTWELRDRYFDYDHYLRTVARAVATDRGTQVLTGRLAEIAELVDDYTTHRLFAKTIDFTLPDNYKVLAYKPIQDHVVDLFRNILSDMLGQPRYEVRRGVWRRVSDLPRIFARREYSVETRKCIYPLMGHSARHGGLERDVMRDLLDSSGEVRAWCKLQRKHDLQIAYRDPSGLSRTYEVDFLVRTDEGCYLLETKSDDYLTHPTVGVKTRAADQWCKSVCGIRPDDIDQPDRWEYLLLNEKTYYANRGSSFKALVPTMRRIRDQVIAEQFHGSLFVK